MLSWLNSYFQEKFEDRILLNKVLVLIATSILVTLSVVTTLSSYVEPSRYIAGDVAQRTVRSPKTFLLEDKVATNISRNDATSRVPSIFVVNDSREFSLENRIAKVFSVLDSLLIEDSGKSLLSPSEKENFEKQFKVNLVGEEWVYLEAKENQEKISEKLVEILEPVYKKGVISSKKALREVLSSQAKSIVVFSSELGADGNLDLVQKVNSGKTSFGEMVSEDRFYDLAEAYSVVEKSNVLSSLKLAPTFKSLLKKLSLSLISPNVEFDAELGGRVKEQILAKLDKVYLRVKRGEVIVRAGDLIDITQAQKLDYLVEQQASKNKIRTILSSFLLCVLVLSVVYLFVSNFWQKKEYAKRDLWIMSLVLFGSFVLFHLHLILAESLGIYFTDVPSSAFIPATPLAAGGMILQVVLGAASVFIYSISFGLLSLVFLGGNWLTLLLIVIGNFYAALWVKKCVRRSALVYAGFRVAIVNFLVSLSFVLFQPEYSLDESVVILFCAVIGGLLSSMLSAGLIPIAESIGGYVTDIKLLELASLDRPLLRELSIEAPGTWNHSMVMAQMGEVAAEAIGANGVLTRVAAYYHDIGKIKKPDYFVENQAGKENKHDKLVPSMSALIIKAHVKDGIELARQHKLPEQLVDFIPQHHGNSLIKFFYEKALKEAEEEEVVDETYYRYPGPKPQTREAGILMLADAIEASSRTLSDPTPAKIQGLVQKMINNVFASGELEESNLTLRDLHVIAKNFTRVLTGIHHKRVEYSEPAEKTKSNKLELVEDNKKADKEKLESNQEDKNGTRASSEKEGKGELREGDKENGAKKNSKEALKRLGI